LVDLSDYVPLPEGAEKVREIAKIPIQAGIDDVVEGIIEAEQNFHDWLREKLGRPPRQ
jgi:hypothetical protein